MKKTKLQSQIVIYKTEDGETKIDVRFDEDTVWLTQNEMSNLFQSDRTNIAKHIKNIFETKELDQTTTCAKIARHLPDGRKYDVLHYNLDVIISVGYRINSIRGTQFRIWATQRLSEFIVKGFILDDERLKNPDLPFDYFEELTRRIQEIRTSEKRFYRKITDIYATSVDYDPTDEQSILFFKTVQNKVHWAITGKTAAEIINERVDSRKLNIGLTNFRGGKPTKEEVIIAKNYLNENELLELNNLVEQYLIFAEGQAMRKIPMHMKDWIDKLHGFLNLNDRKILDNAGKISHELAKEIAEKEYAKYIKKLLNKPSKADLDFDKFIDKSTKIISKAKRERINITLIT